MKITELSAAEREVMEIVWDRGEVTAREARDALSRDVARNTVRTLLERMEEKGWVTHREVGRTFVYRAAHPREETIGRKVQELVDSFCGGSTETLVAALLDYRGLRPGELERIRKMLKEAKGGRLKNG
ncbi:BlaI/MecI/CopY family transcriptional regulator [Gimesia fumaroli]|uniref:Penicillinase repressor n=1 Tax=Gimesia fumaroli TaxID=2527976 RepID=A0A518IFA2_9PLAN|nr:BlaI/MecI/CopY family transcriptional regulator [Gimesia fumaroli]QDV51765.1 Penicillinase repressor [Gimesia fumaroli]